MVSLQKLIFLLRKTTEPDRNFFNLNTVQGYFHFVHFVDDQAFIVGELERLGNGFLNVNSILGNRFLEIVFWVKTFLSNLQQQPGESLFFMINLKDVPWMHVREVFTPYNYILRTELYSVYVQLVCLDHYRGLYHLLTLDLLHLLLPW